MAKSADAATGGELIGMITSNGGNADIVLTGGDYTITLPSNAPAAKVAPELAAAPTITYNGVISGRGTITVQAAAGAGALVLTNTSTYSLPTARLRAWSEQQKVARYEYDGITLNGDGRPPGTSYMPHGHNPPALTIARGAIVMFTDQANAAGALLTSHATPPGVPTQTHYNTDAIRVDGALVIANFRGCPYCRNFGELSGTGVLINHDGGFGINGTNTFTGRPVLYSANIGGGHNWATMSRTAPIFNQFVLAMGIGPATTGAEPNPGFIVVPQNIYEDHHGNSIHNYGYGDIRFSGTYNYTDSGDTLHPALSNPDLNFTFLKHNASHRILYLYRSITTFGDGTNHTFFLPGNPMNLTINTGAVLAFNYNGPVTFNGTMNTAAKPASTDVVVRGTPGNQVTFTQPQYYNGLTKIDAGGILQFGDGTRGKDNPTYSATDRITGRTLQGHFNSSGGNGSILTAESPGGLPGDAIVNNGTLVINNVRNAVNGVQALTLSNIRGAGALDQKGTLPLTLTGNLSYTGPTVIEHGVLTVRHASLATSRSVTLSNPGATLDLSQAGDTRIQDLTGVAGSTVILGGNTLTVGTSHSTTFAGTIVGGHLIKIGSGTLNLTGRTPAVPSSPVPSGGNEVTLTRSDHAAPAAATPAIAAGIQQTPTHGAQHRTSITFVLLGLLAALLAGGSILLRRRFSARRHSRRRSPITIR